MQIGVCSWCIDRNDPARAVRAAGEFGLHSVQIGFFSERTIDEADAAIIGDAARAARVRIVGAFAAFDGEDYSSVRRINETGGLLPDRSWPDRLRMAEKVAALAADLDCHRIGIHVGTVPDDRNSAAFGTLVGRCRQVADALASRNLGLLLETGREPVERLVTFLDSLDRPNVAVGFDPGNVVIYGTGRPVDAVRRLRGRIKLVHVKDAKPPDEPGVSLGRQTALGAGAVEVARVISKLRATGYDGPLLLETDTRDGGLAALRNAADYLRSMLV